MFLLRITCSPVSCLYPNPQGKTLEKQTKPSVTIKGYLGNIKIRMRTYEFPSPLCSQYFLSQTCFRSQDFLSMMKVSLQSQTRYISVPSFEHPENFGFYIFYQGISDLWLGFVLFILILFWFLKILTSYFIVSKQIGA